MIGMVSVLSATTRMHGLSKQNRERALVQNTCRSVAERIHALSYEFSDDDASTWSEDLIAALAPGGEIGDQFDVRGLSGLPGRSADGLITVITDETSTDADIGVRIGMPRDLNGDDATSSTDVTSGARILPVIMEVRWTSPSGESSYRHAFLVMGY
jgi:hypothetical protein